MPETFAFEPHLPLTENGALSQKLIEIAAAYLSPGGFDGKRLDIPESEVTAVKARIRRAARELDILESDKFRWVRDEPVDRVMCAEAGGENATFDASSGKGRMRIIEAGLNKSKTRIYPREVLKRDGPGVFSGLKMYRNHATYSEDMERPEGDIGAWVATVGEAQWDDARGALYAPFTVIDDSFKSKLSNLKEAGQLDQMGVSIRAIGEGVREKHEGLQVDVIERLVKGRSVDFVTEPGAGGRVEVYESDPSTDIDLISEAALRERRPDLTERIENKVLKENQKQMATIEELQAENDKLKARNSDLEESNKALTTEKETAEAEAKKAAAQAAIKEAIDATDLPDVSKVRLRESYANADSDEGLAEDIKREADYVAKLTESKGDVTGLGDRGGADTSAADETASKKLFESQKARYMRQGDSEEVAERKARAFVSYR